MSNQVSGSDNSFTRRDLPSDDRSVTRRDMESLIFSEANHTRCDNVESSESHTRLDTGLSKEYQRINLPSSLDKRYEIIESLPTRGGEADLLRIKNRGDSEQFIAKLYRSGITPREEIISKVQKIAKEYSDFFAQVIEYSYSSESSYEILEYIPYGSLADLIKSNSQLNKIPAYAVLKQLSSAINILHQNDIVHRDLKPDNILIRQLDPLQFSLIDFGISSLLDGATQKFTSQAGTVKYAPPEAWLIGDGEKGTSKVRNAFDYWSLGMILVEILTGKHPFDGLASPAIHASLSENKIDLSEIKDIRWKNICEALLERNTLERAGQVEIEQWLAGQTLAISGSKSKDDGYVHEAITPYLINKKRYYTRQNLARGLADNWEEGIKRVLRDDIGHWLRGALKDYDLSNAILDIAEDKSLDKNLKLVLAINKLDPTLEPIYRQYSLSKKGLLTIAQSKDPETIEWLHKHRVLKEYGEKTDKNDYIVIDATWHEAINRFHKLFEIFKESSDIANDLVEQKKEELHAELLMFSVSEERRNKLKTEVQKEASSEALQCEWFANFLRDKVLEDLSIADLYLILLLSPLARNIGKKNIEKEKKKAKLEEELVETEKKRLEKENRERVAKRTNELSIIRKNNRELVLSILESVRGYDEALYLEISSKVNSNIHNVNSFVSGRLQEHERMIRQLDIVKQKIESSLSFKLSLAETDLEQSHELIQRSKKNQKTVRSSFKWGLIFLGIGIFAEVLAAVIVIILVVATLALGAAASG